MVVFAEEPFISRGLFWGLYIKTFFAFAVVLFLSFQIISQTYTIGVEDIDYMPYYGINENGDYIGLAADLLTTFAVSENITFNFIPLPILRLSQNFNVEQLDFRFPDNPDWNDSISDLYFSDPATQVIDGLMVRKGERNLPLNRYTIIGTIRGYTAPALENYLKTENYPDIIKKFNQFLNNNQREIKAIYKSWGIYR